MHSQTDQPCSTTKKVNLLAQSPRLLENWAVELASHLIFCEHVRFQVAGRCSVADSAV